jgi:hypothetical protein
MSEVIQVLHSPAYSAGESGRRGACDGCAQEPCRAGGGDCLFRMVRMLAGGGFRRERAISPAPPPVRHDACSKPSHSIAPHRLPRADAGERGSDESDEDLTHKIAVVSEMIQVLHSPAYSAGESGRRGACDGCAQVPCRAGGGDCLFRMVRMLAGGGFRGERAIAPAPPPVRHDACSKPSHSIAPHRLPRADARERGSGGRMKI